MTRMHPPRLQLTPGSFDNDLDMPVAQVVRLAKKYRRATAQQKILENSGRAFLCADSLSLLAAFIAGGALAWALNIYVLGGAFQKIFSYPSLQQIFIFSGLGFMSLAWLDSKGHYRQRLPYWESVGQILRVTVVGLMIGGFIEFALKNSFSRLWLGFSWSFFAVFLFTGRALVKHILHRRGLWNVAALIIGEGRTAKAVAEALHRETQMGFSIVGHIGIRQLERMAPTPGAWTEKLQRAQAHYVFIALEGGEMERHADAVRHIARAQLAYSLVPPWLGLPSSTLSPHHFMMNDVMLLHNTNRLSLPFPRLIKRGFDIVLAGAGLLFAALPMLVIAMMVRRDGGPAFFAQPRIGHDGKIFSCYKFRSMRMDADTALQEYLASDADAAAEWRIFQKLAHDPRITPFGNLIRRTSLDELPQLFNVLKGEMSLVGPRPIMQGQENFYSDDFSYYTSVRPGITGPWQVSGRNALTFSERVVLESWYVRNWTLWMDIVILCKTIPALLRQNTH